MKKIIFIFLFPAFLFSSDWPLYKGNIYFTGNNDEITVKNANLKWLFQADDRVFNPVASDGLLFFVDIRGQVYCLDEETGLIIWKKNMREISSQFASLHKAAGKIKYPLIKGNTLFLSDPVAIYALDKYTGKALWARTGMREDDLKIEGLAGKKTRPAVDGIYSDPVILDDEIYYGTRETFHSRSISNGGSKWNNSSIKSFSAFPTFYDEYIFTQSMDYSKNVFSVICMNSKSGQTVWEKPLQAPVRIFPPVVYKGKVYIPSTTKLYALNLLTGELVFEKDYGRYITSNPSFTDRSILFTIDNRNVAVVDPDNGEIIRELENPEQSSPSFVTVRDQVYVAYNTLDTDKRSFGNVKASDFSDNSIVWQYKTPFPGAVGQPSASNGILFLPAGNYIYAIGALYYPKIVKGGSANNSENNPPDNKGKVITDPKPEADKTREVAINVTDDAGKPVSSIVEIKKYDDKGRLVFESRESADDHIIRVPEGDNVEVLIESGDYIPKKVIVNKDDRRIDESLERIEKGKSFVVENVNFEFGKAHLRKESLNILDNLVNTMKKNPRLRIEVRGYTDDVGDEKFNQKLSEKRADAVTDYMIKNGISPERIKGAGFGEKNPIADNKTVEGRNKNRRTEFFIADK
ncbi:MAG: OmpA family protein [Spirochaetes bacterium]|nr:OmpA family protein [Spirochaetota bacterium]